MADAVSVTSLPPAMRLVLRGDPAAMLAAGAVFGVAISLTPCRAGVAEDRAALWLGPDEQLLIASAQHEARLTVALQTALLSYAHSLVNVSHRQVAFEVKGRSAPDLLNSACPLDLHLKRFPPGMCTRTVYANAEIVLWRTTESAFRVEVWRSFAGYVSSFFAEAMKDYV